MPRNLKYELPLLPSLLAGFLLRPDRQPGSRYGDSETAAGVDSVCVTTADSHAVHSTLKGLEHFLNPAHTSISEYFKLTLRYDNISPIVQLPSLSLSLGGAVSVRARHGGGVQCPRSHGAVRSAPRHDRPG